MQALTTKLTAAAEDLGLPREDGCTSPTVWLASTTNVSKREASKLVSLTRVDPTRGRITQERWSTGRLTTEMLDAVFARAQEIHQVNTGETPRSDS